MAFLDVTDVLLDPDFMDRGLTCERLAQVVTDDGLAVNTPTLTTFAAVITSDRGDLLVRLAAGERIEGSITIHSRFRLMEGTAGQTADIVHWRGRRYTVSRVDDYSHFGRGFTAATCDLIPLSG